MLGLYIHIPFCNSICPYCDFCKRVSSEKVKQTYLKALLEEMKIKKLDAYAFDTLYIGGGTPSSLQIDDLEKLFQSLSKYIDLKSMKEFTFECNPLDITPKLCTILAKYHVNRVSIGVQTFQKKLQRVINRYITIEEIKEKISLLQSVKITNVNIDMMFAIPSQSFSDVESDLKKLLELDIQHISYYSLILEEHTIFSHLQKAHKLECIDEKLEAKMYHHICHTLEKGGFNRYETSNFSKKGYESLHNLIYWNCEEYIALGLGASSYYHSIRSTTTTHMQNYLDGIQKNVVVLQEEIKLSIEDKMKETVILELRKKEGIDEKKFYQLFHIDIKCKFQSIYSLIGDGLLVEEKNYLFIPQKYVYITNHIILKII